MDSKKPSRSKRKRTTKSMKPHPTVPATFTMKWEDNDVYIYEDDLRQQNRIRQRIWKKEVEMDNCIGTHSGLLRNLLDNRSNKSEERIEKDDKIVDYVLEKEFEYQKVNGIGPHALWYNSVPRVELFKGLVLQGESVHVPIYNERMEPVYAPIYPGLPVVNAPTNEIQGYVTPFDELSKRSMLITVPRLEELPPYNQQSSSTSTGIVNSDMNTSQMIETNVPDDASNIPIICQQEDINIGGTENLDIQDRRVKQAEKTYAVGIQNDENLTNKENIQELNSSRINNQQISTDSSPENNNSKFESYSTAHILSTPTMDPSIMDKSLEMNSSLNTPTFKCQDIHNSHDVKPLCARELVKCADSSASHIQQVHYMSTHNVSPGTPIALQPGIVYQQFLSIHKSVSK